MREDKFHSLVKLAFKNKASDIHLRTDEVPLFRIRGELVPIQAKAIKRDEIKQIIHIVLGDDKNRKEFSNAYEHDGSYEVKGVCRLRYNYFRYQNKLGIILRLIKMDIPTVEGLGLATVLNKIAEQRRGLILLTGETGSGKSTSLAAMIHHVNKNRHAHIITIEDPIEYQHTQIKSRITQREIGVDTTSFATGLRAALRQDPDIILIGEMRDTETISIALKAAETGHTVFSTVHTTDAVSTIGRIISMFPSSEQTDVAKRLAENLYSTISQRLLKGKTKTGLVAAQEIMIMNPGIKECILGEEEMGMINKIIAKGQSRHGEGTQTFDQHILDLYRHHLISKETALEAVKSQSDFLRQLDMDDDDEYGEDEDDELIR